MELAHGGGTLSVTAGSKVHFLDILRYVASFLLVLIVIFLVVGPCRTRSSDCSDSANTTGCRAEANTDVKFRKKT